MNLIIEELNDANTVLWDDFNHKMDEGTFFHTTKWKEVLESLGYSSHYYIIFNDHQPVAICPFFETKIKTFKGITTLPFSDYNHIIIKENHPAIINFIEKELLKRATENSWSFILINSLNKQLKNNFNNLKYPHSGTMVIDLEKLNPDKIWNDVFNSKVQQRRHINNFKKNEFQIREIESPDDMEIFYKYYLSSIEHIQGVKFTYSHFMELYDLYFPENMHINLLYKDNYIAGGLLDFSDDSTAYARYLAINRQIPCKFNVTYKLLWEFIKKAHERGSKKVCLGNTPNDKTNRSYRIKRNIGGKYENSYSTLIPTSKLFKLSYNTYNSIIGIK